MSQFPAPDPESSPLACVDRKCPLVGRPTFETRCTACGQPTVRLPWRPATAPGRYRR